MQRLPPCARSRAVRQSAAGPGPLNRIGAAVTGQRKGGTPGRMPPFAARTAAELLAIAARRHLRLIQVQPALRDVLVARGHVLGRLGPLPLGLEGLALELADDLILPERGGWIVAGHMAAV